ncbi:YqaJ viral recombinase family protein [Kitasatospora sp. NPDC056076]|uniref:YqaJ viral recombinase family nuclease n=1 Tax=Kitasatospora sp. NPDC056076 TaxID=3345703 RepID=UPI0035E30375
MSEYLYRSGARVVLAPGSGPDDPAWHETRLGGLGGSDIAAICGLDKYTSPLEIWHTKTGNPAPRRDDTILSEAGLMGHLLEPIVAQRFTDITGLPAFPSPGTLRALDPEWALANLDRVTLEDGEYGVLELKTRSSYALNEWLDEPPTGPWLQVQHYLGVTGWSYGYIACLIGGQRTIVHRVDRDDDTITGLRAIGGEFWELVQHRTPPPVSGSAACTDLLNRLHPEPTTTSVVADAVEVEHLLRERRDALLAMAGPQAVLDAAENRLKAIAGPAREVHIRGHLAYEWAPRPGQISWKAAALAADPDINPEPYRGAPSRTLRIPQENL